METIKTVLEFVFSVFDYIKKKKLRVNISFKDAYLEGDDMIADLEIENASKCPIVDLSFCLDYYFKRKYINYYESPYECNQESTICAKIRIPKYKRFGQFVLYSIIVANRKVYVQEYIVCGNDCGSWDKSFYLKRNGKMKFLYKISV